MAELITNDNYQDFTLEMLKSPDGITKLNGILRQLSQNIAGDTESVRIYRGVGTPEASVAAGVGSLYMRTDGGSDTSVYRKESGSGNTGWVAVKAPASLPLSVANGGLGADNSGKLQGTILYVSATGVISFLGTGTSGYFLKTQGAGADPIWTKFPSDYAAGDYLIYHHGYIYAGSGSSSYTKVFEMKVPKAGTLRIKFFGVSRSGSNNYGKIYRNGVAVGTEQGIFTANGTDYTEDIAGWSAGDLLQLYHKTNGNNGALGGVRLYDDGSSNESSTYVPQKMWKHDDTIVPSALGDIGDFCVASGGGASTTLYVKTAASTWTAK